jgi:DHA2 family multidrug resistance protein
MPVVGILLRRYQARWLVIFGVVVSATGLIAMSHFTLQVDYATAVRGRIVQSFGLAFYSFHQHGGLHADSP